MLGPDGLTFIDLGSGFGKPCLAAALVLKKELKKCIGIEYLDGLYAKSLELKEVYDKETTAEPVVDFIKGDFLADTTWSNEVDILFMNATCFEPHMVTSISKTLEDKLKPGAIVIMTTKVLEVTSFRKIGPFKKDMSWGTATVNIYIKL